MPQVKIAIFACALLLAGCGETPLYTKSYSFAGQKWNIDTKPVFRFNVTDTTKFYTVTISLRTTTEYDYSDLWFFLYSKAPNGETGRVPYKFQLANADGSWAGTKSGSAVEQQIRFRHRKFPQKGWYTFTLEQGITEETVRDVLDISLTVEDDKQQ
jgi:gliding motility-associated lipoprotein GldH